MLNASDAATNDYFGSSVAISRRTGIVGAYQDDSYKGSAYVFESSCAPGILQPLSIVVTAGETVEFSTPDHHN